MPLPFVDHNVKGDSAVHVRTWAATALALLATLSAALVALAASAPSMQPDGLRALDGEWTYVEDRTEGRALEQLGPPMSSTFSMRVEEGAVVLNGHGSGHRDVRVALDGSITEVAEPKRIVRYRGAWKRWSPPLGGAMLAMSRTVNNNGRMSAFEYLRIVERDGGLVYIAQPGGNTPTEFVLTELGKTRAVFDNPRHDYPKRIVYELSAEGGLSATIGYAKGGSPRRFEFKREGS